VTSFCGLKVCGDLNDESHRSHHDDFKALLALSRKFLTPRDCGWKREKVMVGCNDILIHTIFTHAIRQPQNYSKTTQTLYPTHAHDGFTSARFKRSRRGACAAGKALNSFPSPSPRFTSPEKKRKETFQVTFRGMM
jgi:hypothetical protein